VQGFDLEPSTDANVNIDNMLLNNDNIDLNNYVCASSSWSSHNVMKFILSFLFLDPVVFYYNVGLLLIIKIILT